MILRQNQGESPLALFSDEPGHSARSLARSIDSGELSADGVEARGAQDKLSDFIIGDLKLTDLVHVESWKPIFRPLGAHALSEVNFLRGAVGLLVEMDLLFNGDRGLAIVMTCVRNVDRILTRIDVQF